MYLLLKQGAAALGPAGQLQGIFVILIKLAMYGIIV